MKYLFLIFSILCSFQIQAHIPEYETIMIRVATNHGNGTYEIQRLVKWSEAGVPMEVAETWTVGENGQMKLEIKGLGRMRDQIQGEVVYSTDRKTFVQDGKQVGSSLSKTFVEHYFHLRSSKALRNLLVRAGLAPRESLENRPSLGTGPTVKYKPQDFMSLARVDGTIAYAVGNPQSPTFFVAQDQFVVSKIAIPNGPTVVAKNFQNYSGGLQFPKTVTYSWGTHSLEVTTQKVTYLGRKSGESFKASVPLKIPATPLLNEFYSQFR